MSVGGEGLLRSLRQPLMLDFLVIRPWAGKKKCRGLLPCMPPAYLRGPGRSGHALLESLSATGVGRVHGESMAHVEDRLERKDTSFKGLEASSVKANRRGWPFGSRWGMIDLPPERSFAALQRVPLNQRGSPFRAERG